MFDIETMKFFTITEDNRLRYFSNVFDMTVFIKHFYQIKNTVEELVSIFLRDLRKPSDSFQDESINLQIIRLT